MQTRFSAAQLADPDMAASEAVIRKCVHCGFCLPTCPTYDLLGDERDSPRGRVYLIKDMLENERAPTPQMVAPIDRCLSCLACMTACPSGVNYMRLVDHARAYIEARYTRPPAERLLRGLLARVLPYPGRFRLALALGRLAAPFRGAAGGRLRALLDLAARPRRARRAAAPQPPVQARGRVVILKGCAERVLRPQIRQAARRLAARAGFETAACPAEGCCGAIVHHLGRQAEAQGLARRNIDAWLRDGEPDAILACASGCGTHIKSYGFLLRADPAYAQKAARVSDLARDVSEFLEEAGLPPAGSRPGGAVAYQSACSLQHGQGVSAAPRRLLADAGFEVREPAEGHLCCGSAGTYNILQPQIAGQLRDRKAAALAATGAPVAATGNIGCLTQLSIPGAPVMVHTVELLDWAYGGPRPEGMA